MNIIKQRKHRTPILLTSISLVLIWAFLEPPSIRGQGEWTTNGSNINSTNTGNVGIGTTSPAAKLDVNGPYAPASTGGTNGILLIGALPSTNLVLSAGVEASSNVYSWFQSRNRLSATYYNLVFQPNGGNVGVGTIAPAYKLDVAGAIRSTSGGFIFPDGTVQTTAVGGGGGSSLWIASGSNIYYNAGNVSIGTSTPTEYFQVEKNQNAYTSFLLRNNNTGAAAATRIMLSNSGTNDDDALSLYSFGTGFGTTGAFEQDAGLLIAGSQLSGGLNLVSRGGNMKFFTGGYQSNFERMRIDAAGNVGIGTPTPNTLLTLNRSQNAGTVISIDNSYNAASNAAYTGFFLRQGGLDRFFFGSINDNNTSQNGGPKAVQLWNFVNGPMLFATNNVERARIDAAGNVGIGTTSPAYKLDVAGSINSSGGLCIAGDCKTAWSQVGGGGTQWGTSGSNIFYNTGSVGVGTNTPTTARFVVSGNVADGGGNNVVADFTSGASNSVIKVNATGGTAVLGSDTNGDTYLGTTTAAKSTRVFAGGQEAVRVQSNGNVGIGTTNATKRLTVNGDIEVSGNINAKYQDVAEWVDSSQRLSAGTVVILDPERTNQVIASSRPYDTRVAGVVSDRPGVLLGEAGDGKLKVATTGRVRVRVDASRGPIKIGDLLVTGDKEGVAMKSVPVMVGGREMHSPGTILGKALEPLASGQAEILVLLSLQ